MPTDRRPVPIEDLVRRSLTVVADRIEPTPDWPAVLTLDVPMGDATDGPSSNGGPRPEPAPSRRVLAVGVAAVIITLVASVALIVSARTTDDVRSGPPTTADRPPTTTSTPTRVGEQITVDADALPPDVVFLDEEVSRNGIVSAVFGPPGADPAEQAPTGPTIRITAYPVTPNGSALVDRAAAAYPDATFSEVDGHPAFTAATTGNPGWTTLSWEPRPTLAIAVTTSGIEAEARARVAETVRLQSTSVATQPSTDPAIAARQLSVSFGGTFPDGLATIDVVHSPEDFTLQWSTSRTRPWCSSPWAMRAVPPTSSGSAAGRAGSRPTSWSRPPVPSRSDRLCPARTSTPSTRPRSGRRPP